jgi:putative effector of murein hydrolase LrgA (UPF0299 family)
MLPFVILLCCAIAGEAVQRALHLPVPGPVLGLLLLLALLAMRRRTSEALQSTARSLLARLPLLFVPAGVGIIAHLALIRAEWLPIGAAIAGSTVVAILATAFAVRAIERRDTLVSAAAPLTAEIPPSQEEPRLPKPATSPARAAGREILPHHATFGTASKAKHS